MSASLAVAFKGEKIEITLRDMMSAQRKRFLSVAMTISLSLETVIKSQKISEVLFSARGVITIRLFFAACLYFDVVVKIGSNKLIIK